MVGPTEKDGTMVFKYAFQDDVPSKFFLGNVQHFYVAKIWFLKAKLFYN